jgi:sugar phosphate permease
MSESMAAAANPASAARPFYGWRVVGAGFTAQMLSTGVTFAPFGVFVIPLSEAFDVTRGKLSLALSIAFLAMGVMGPIVGRWLDRGHARVVMLSGTLLAAAGLFGIARAATLWQLGFFFCGVVAIGASFFGMTPSMALVASWFVRRRGLALGITVAGATVASFVTPPLAAYLIDHVGWRGAFAYFGVGILVIGLPVFGAFAIARPESVGQRPDGDPPEEETAPDSDDSSAPASQGIETAALIRDPRLWLLAVGFGLVFTSPIVMILALVPFAEDLGISRQNAAYFFSAAAPFSLLGKIVFGALADRIAPHRAIWLVVIGNMIVWALLYTDPNYSMLLVIGAIYGVGIGATGPLHGVILGRCFGRVAFGRASGIGGLGSLPLIALAPALAGYLYDTTGSYHVVFIVQVVALLMGGLLLSFVRIPKVSTD